MSFILTLVRVSTGCCTAYVLVRKLYRIGVHSAILAWIQSYLSDRELFVRMCGWISNPIKATSGVPEGSHLGHLLFIIFENVVPEILNYSNCLMFTDDLKIFCSVKSILDALNLQRDLDMLNRLSLNTNKCKIMSFYRCHYPVIFNYETLGNLLEIV